MKKRACLLAFASVAVIGCGDDAGSSTDNVIRADSAGVEVVTHTADLDGTVMEIVGEPVLVVAPGEETTGDARDVVFFQLGAVVPLGGGRFAVGSSGSQMVYVFDEEGGHERTIGGPGEGPGEFGAVTGVAVLEPDTVVVLDNRLRRLTVFTPAGEVVRTVDVASFLPPARGATMHASGGGLWLTGIASVGGGKSPGVYRDSAATYRLSPVGDSLEAYGPFPGSEVVLTEQIAGGLPFGATLASGARGGRLIIGTGSTTELLEFSVRDRPARIIRWPDHDREVTPERAGAWVDFQLDALPAPAREQVGPMLSDLPYSPLAPAYRDLVVASDGTIWLGDYPGPEAFHPMGIPSMRTWTLIDSDGVRLRLVRTPPGFTVTAVRDGLIYGTHRDELGVESVRVYEVPG